MTKKYTKPTMQDLSGIPLAVGGCTSGQGVPNRCLNFGWSNATSCVDGSGVGSPPASCPSTGFLALDCTSGKGAGV